jgi:uncharacterized membrane protein YcjF (UPF0283 family)
LPVAGFRDSFRGELDTVAEACVNSWASRIWVEIAVAPNAMVDRGATLFYTFSMHSDQYQVYNRRAGRAGMPG